MSNYNIQVNWFGKDDLPENDPEKVISGHDFQLEFTAVKNTFNSKADVNGSLLNDFYATTANDGVNNGQVATTHFVYTALANYVLSVEGDPDWDGIDLAIGQSVINTVAATQLNIETAIAAMNAAIQLIIPDDNDIVNAVSSDLTSASGILQSSIESISTTAVDNDGRWALSSDVTTLSSEVGGNTSSINTINQTITTNDLAYAQSLTDLNTSIGSSITTLTNDLTTYSTAQTSLATDITTLSSNLNGNYVTSTDLNATYATNDGVDAIRQVALDVNGNITGWTAVNGTNGSAFLIQADKFAISNQTHTATPFAIDTVTGQAVFSGKVSFANVTGTDDIATASDVSDAIANDVTAIHGSRITTGTINVQDQNLSGLLDVTASTGAIGWGKTGPHDFTNTGLFIGNEGGNAYMNFGSANRYFYYDGGNDILFFTGQTVTGLATLNSKITYDNSGTIITHNIPASVDQLTITLAGGGGGSAGVTGFDNEFGIVGANGSSGGTTTVKHFSVGGTLKATHTSGGGTGGSFSPNSRLFVNSNNVIISGSEAATVGISYSSGGLTGTGGTAATRNNRRAQSVSTTPSSAPAGDGTGVGSSGGLGGYAGNSDGVWGAQVWLGLRGSAAASATSATLTTASGDYLEITVGAGGNGTSFTGISGASENRRYIWSSGGGADGACRVEITSLV
jgi:hypothetical protein